MNVGLPARSSAPNVSLAGIPVCCALTPKVTNIPNIQQPNDLMTLSFSSTQGYKTLKIMYANSPLESNGADKKPGNDFSVSHNQAARQELIPS